MGARIAGLLLAAGGGRRIGAPKALLRRDGALLVEHGVRVLAAGGCAPVLVVLGAQAERVRAAADLTAATVVVNSGWATGMGSSLRAGLAAAGETDVEGVVVLPVDMPGVTPEAVRRVVDGAGPQALVCATYAGRRSHPVLLGRAHWAGVSTLAAADVGARAYLMAHAARIVKVPCDDVADDTDIDTPEAAAAGGVEVPGA